MAARRLSGLLLLVLSGVVGALFWLSGQEAEGIRSQAKQEPGAPPIPLYPGGIDHRDLDRNPPEPAAAETHER
jgi:hypothetical protein